MNMRLIFGSAIVMVLLLFASGCTQPAQPVATPTPTAVPTTLPPTTAVPVVTTLSTPGPVQTLPPVWSIDVQVNSNGNAIDPQVIMTFQGGKGQNLITEIDMQVTRADGSIDTAKMTQPLFVGKTVSLKGSGKPDAAAEAWGTKDRAEVWVYTPQGDKIKIYDAYVPFRSYN